MRYKIYSRMVMLQVAEGALTLGGMMILDIIGRIRHLQPLYVLGNHMVKDFLTHEMPPLTILIGSLPELECRHQGLLQ